ncbi:NUDIX hydrolase [Roseivirga sp.]|uniref:NUDIX hydrolase n=1 Tax=Roseivirga sp. TaxID=1964215 RepID=UPI003B52E9B2
MKQGHIFLTVDAVVFGYEAPDNLLILLIKRGVDPYKDFWALPGGFVKEEESLEEGVERELQEETGVQVDYLEQLYSFGAPDRDPRARIVSVSYFGLIKPKGLELKPSTDAAEAQWFRVNKLPELAFDHKLIIDKAISRLRAKITYEPIGFELLNEKFSFSELENLYTTLLGRPIDRRNFRKKILSFGLLEQLDEQRKEGPGRPASLFKFQMSKYKSYQKNGLYFEL